MKFGPRSVLNQCISGLRFECIEKLVSGPRLDVNLSERQCKIPIS